MAHYLFIQAYDYDTNGNKLKLAQPYTTITGDSTPFGTGAEVAMDEDSNRRRLMHRKVKTADDTQHQKKRKKQPLARHVTIPKPTGNVAKKEVLIDVSTHSNATLDPRAIVLWATYTAAGKFSVRIREIEERGNTKSARTRTRIFRNPDKTIRGVLYARGQTRVCISPA